MNKTHITVPIVVALALSVLLGQIMPNCMSYVAPVTGAIFTTDKTGLLVNGNIYEYGTDVYLSGGPGPNAPPTAAGLPDAEYYFQVTDPPGKKLLSLDGIGERRFKVEGGIITQYLGTTHKWNSIPEIPGAIVIQLWPFDKTPNKGGVYKAWATPVEDYDPTDPHSFWGFIPKYSKTDNYKVRITKLVTLTLDKFYDVNNNGIYDDGDYLLEGWRIDVKDPLGVTNTYYTPRVIDVTGNPGFYTVTEELPAGWEQTAVAIDGAYIVPPKITVNVNIANGGTHSVLYGNRKLTPPPGCLEVKKFNDKDGNGVFDGADEWLADWPIYITDPSGDASTHATPVSLEITEFGAYIITEDLPVGWEQTVVLVDGTPQTLDPTTTVTVNPGESYIVIYGNRLPGRLIIKKFNDKDNNGVFDGTDVWLSSWNIDVEDPSGDLTSYTAVPIDLIITEFGTYTITEAIPAGWVQTALIINGALQIVNPTAKVTINPGDTYEVHYGNYQPPPPAIGISLTISPIGTHPVGSSISFTWTISSPSEVTPVSVKLRLIPPSGPSLDIYTGTTFPADFAKTITWTATTPSGTWWVNVIYTYEYLGVTYSVTGFGSFNVT